METGERKREKKIQEGKKRTKGKKKTQTPRDGGLTIQISAR